ncbi:phospholipase D-like protein [Kribbella amoyensis]|uniref:Phospholipase D-like protein n=1 Tax=Kribbella amoyensis TaxID=996641 RepID=A0A561BMF2_9ACTN|nr:SHOCT domain-containing protein [Kribbella amoyensis]TWD80061.1 phospholipase D-like protein [Kribbella amoyensis]
MSFWDVVWFICISFLFVAYLMMLFWILADLFRDHETSGWVKAVWIVALFIVPLLTALVYMIARGHGMAERSARESEVVRQRQEAYIRDVASQSTASPVDQINQAKALLDAGTISQAEFDTLKANALGSGGTTSTGNGQRVS